VADLDRLVKKTGKDYEKQTKRDNKAVVESHEVSRPYSPK